MDFFLFFHTAFQSEDDEWMIWANKAILVRQRAVLVLNRKCNANCVSIK